MKRLFLASLVLFLTSTWVSGEETVDWIREGTAAWQPRDSQAEWVFQDRLWIGGGWFDSYHAPPRDVWSTPNGKDWQLVTPTAPWIHSDLPMTVTYDGKMWLMGGWYNGRLPGHSASREVWASADGIEWQQSIAAAPWSARCAGCVVEHQGRMWVLGGTENYYFGTDKSLKNDVWSSADGTEWRQETAKAEWSPRAFHQAVVLNNRIYVLGGGNYVPNYSATNDVWSSKDGIHWTCETNAAPWASRLWFSATVYRNRIWVLGGWSKEMDNYGDVWHSANGKDWQQLTTKTCWKSRHEHSTFVLNDKLWLVGGHARPLSNEVWSLSLPKNWKP